MSESFIRFYKPVDPGRLTENLLIYGALSGHCAKCQKMDVALNASHCPECHTEFKYIAFREIRSHLPKLKKIQAQRPSVQIIDYDDYHRVTGAARARKIFGSDD